MYEEDVRKNVLKTDTKYQLERNESLPISRVLSWAIIHLGPASPLASSDLPGPGAGHALMGPYLVLLRVGFTIAVECCHPRGALLPHHFNLTGIRRCLGGILSVALSVGFRRPDVIWHLAQRSPDFPPLRKRSSDCLADSRRGVYRDHAVKQGLQSINS